MDVFVFDEQSIAAFLEKKTPAVESEVFLRDENLRKAEQELREAQHALEEFRRTNDVYQPAFLQQKLQLSVLNREILELNNGPTEARLATIKKMETLQSQMLQSRKSQSLDDAADQLREAFRFKDELNAIDRREKENATVLKSKMARYAELEKQVIAVSGLSTDKAFELSNLAVLRKTACENARNAAAHFPTLEFYLSNALPVPRMKTVTDADGKFELRILGKGKFAVFARAKRKVGSDFENYAWFFWLPTTTGDTPLLLSNNNFVFADFPDNVLPIEPKDTK